MDPAPELVSPLMTTVIGQSGVGVVVFDAELRYVFANQVAADLHQLAAEDHRGRPIAEIVPGAAETLVPVLRRALDGGAPILDTEVSGEWPSTPGQIRHWMASVIPFSDPDHPEVPYVAGVFVEITDRVAERSRLEALARLSRGLNSAMRTDEVSRLVVEHAPAVVDAEFVNLALLDRATQCLVLVQPPMDDDIERRWARLPLDAERTPFHEVLETCEPRFVDRESRARDFLHMVADTDRVGLDTTAAYPLLDAGGVPFGVMGVGWSAPNAIADETRARLALLADLCGQALQRVRTTEARDHLVHDLQVEVLGSQELPGDLDVALAYQPSNNELGFGGDWYDVIAVDPRNTVFVVGDVAGHGTSAAARMTATKATIRAFATAAEPEQVIPRSTEALDHLMSGYIATAALAWVDRELGELRWCLAGHPPPVLRLPGAAARLLAGVHHPPIGMPTAAVELPTLPFPPGAQLILYTDGLVERRDIDIDERLEVLRATVDELPPDLGADAICAELIDRLADDTDDVAVIVVNRPR